MPLDKNHVERAGQLRHGLENIAFAQIDIGVYVRRMKLISLVRSRTTVAVMSSSWSVIVCEVAGGSMRPKTFHERKYCGDGEKSFLSSGR
jgi:hypothetical protein